MDCFACHRNEPSRRFYCPNCVSNRLAEHQARRAQAKNALNLVQAKALALLAPPPASPVLGVREESELKAVKFSLASRVRDARNAATKTQEEVDSERSTLDKRKETLTRRRENLEKAKARLAGLTSLEEPKDDPDSLSNLRSDQVYLQGLLNEIQTKMEDTRAILTRELLAVYSFQIAPPPSPSASAFLASDPFKSSSSSSSSSGSLTSAPVSPTRGDHGFPAYYLAQLPLPNLSEIKFLPPNTLTTLLSLLVHLVRQFGMYYSFALPFTPSPSFFEPGKPGVVPAPGWAVGNVKAFPCFRPRPAGGSSSSEGWTTGKKGRQNGGILTSDSGSASTAAAAATAIGANGTIGIVGGPPHEQQQNGGFDVSVWGDEDDLGGAEQDRAVLGAAVALAYDLAWIIWRRGGTPPNGAASWEDPHLLNDLGLLLLGAAEVSVPGSNPSSSSSEGGRREKVPRWVRFPLNFEKAWNSYSTSPSVVKTVSPGSGDESPEDGWDLV
ncbi:hypothetical protein T439DRAFT_324538 [Meredithblackwellia eburnea MCA 4105]